MIVTKGDVYERDVHDGHVWRRERRMVLDATDGCVLYQLLYDSPEGTHVERDEIADQHQATMKEWRRWTNLARKVNG